MLKEDNSFILLTVFRLFVKQFLHTTKNTTSIAEEQNNEKSAFFSLDNSCCAVVNRIDYVCLFNELLFKKKSCY